MEQHQVNWAMQHDWFIKYSHNGQHYIVLVRDDELPQETRVFSDFRELRAWAGY